MSETVKTPRHVWIVGVIALIWNALGAMDFLMSKFQTEKYLNMMDEAQRAYFTSFPWWINVAWGAAVWGGVLGSILILLRNRLAVPIFGFGLVAMLVNFVYGFFLTDPSMQDVVGGIELAFTAGIIIVAFLLLHYARNLNAAGILK